ncbi:autotransporter outer membrane beta-barrel domain-containing protein [Escherichia coli]|uniref:autotransporter outer membrane beta-barrel domain-containing protein n=1 Tax=Escherichia coli TaxID=562 RepID=UPI00097F9973|nr:autotransporter outer membrane beta-barrel domain-containing protein [Escherichia coli]EFB3120626.1 autotransporter outer membrane beta-barrel domain-containing protein [Escherichia coli]EFB5494118.1 autotransporter outer membrane beta-barrel domain-containing protein [Escherichia coli]EFD4947924.1 autotransporter outer membrane beta-barrel domain-containing protein [Escherichia coli]EFF1852581.1 autotransporter outer membrane beta-barrel domain-containing protein [Escherichia coli]EFH50150
MNKVYSLKYSHITGGLIAVSELTRRITTGSRKKLFSIISLSLIGVITPSVASQMDLTNFYSQDFFDFAQNKGAFKPGAKNITILKKDGSTLELPDVPFPDFSSVSNKGSTTAIGGSYTVTATHNNISHHSISTQGFGQTNYSYIDRMSKGDFAVTRVNKFIVEGIGDIESADINLSQSEALEKYGVMYKGKKQLIGFRAGAGSLIFEKNGKLTKNQNVSYAPDIRNGSFVLIDGWEGERITTNNLFDEFKNRTTGGDSGSSLFVYDNEKNKWVILGTLFGEYHYSNGQIRSAFNKYDQSLVNKLKDYFTQQINLSGKSAVIKNDNITINSSSDSIKVVNQLKNNKTVQMDLSFNGGGTINLEQDLHTGSGGLIFDDSSVYEINGNNYSYKGAGINTGNSSVVNWNVKGIKGNDLHKIGEGTLNIKAMQDGNLKIGDGKVVLQAEKSFDNIYITSGKATVVIDKNNALNNENEFSGLYFSKNGGVLDLNGYDQFFKKIAATDNGATITNTSEKTATLSLSSTSNYLYHGNISNNIQIRHEHTGKKSDSLLILDGDININNDIYIKNAQVVMQGHATSHTVVKNQACGLPSFLCPVTTTAHLSNLEKNDALKNGVAYKANNQSASFEQPDWEDRQFSFRTMILDNSVFTTSRNSFLKGDIISSGSDIYFGSKDDVYIDTLAGENITGNGFSFSQNIKKGVSAGDSGFSGGIYSTDGSIRIGDKANVTLTKSSSMDNTTLTIEKGGLINAQGGLFTSKESLIAGQMNLTGKPDLNTTTWSPSIYLGIGGYRLTEDGAQFTARNQASVIADIYSDKAANISLGREINAESKNTPAYSSFAISLLNGFDTSLEGKINASKSTLSMNDALWKVTGNSSLKKVSYNGSMTLFTGENNKTFSTLTVDELTANKSAFVMRTDMTNSDKLVVNSKVEGQDNILLVNFLQKNGDNKKLNIDLVSTPGGTDKNTFKASTQSIGFSDVTPVIEQRDAENKTTWTLTGYKTVANNDATKKATSLMSGSYKAFLSEVNNLNKRMGDLRDINGEAGAWARIMSGTGSAGGGFSDNYTHVQVGVDKKHELDGLDLFTGFTVTHTDSSASADVFSGKTKSVGAGLYASAMFDSGAYIDLIGKYVHHDNEYTATFAGLGTRDYSTHSWYAGAEAGYRYHVTEDTWIEPQAELVYGAVSGKQFAWKDQGMHLSMKDKDYNPLIGRTGVDVGKSFSGKDWKVTARAGLGYQFDLLANGETVLRDASGEKRIKGEKDSRMLMSVGLNAEIRDNVRFGLEFEKSAFGKYNVDNAVNANFRYSF